MCLVPGSGWYLMHVLLAEDLVGPTAPATVGVVALLWTAAAVRWATRFNVARGKRREARGVSVRPRPQPRIRRRAPPRGPSWPTRPYPALHSPRRSRRPPRRPRTYPPRYTVESGCRGKEAGERAGHRKHSALPGRKGERGGWAYSVSPPSSAAWRSSSRARASCAWSSSSCASCWFRRGP